MEAPKQQTATPETADLSAQKAPLRFCMDTRTSVGIKRSAANSGLRMY